MTKRQEREPDIRLQLVNPRDHLGARLITDADALTREGPGSLLAVATQFQDGQVRYPPRGALRELCGTEDAAFERARARTRVLLLQRRPVIQRQGPLTVWLYDNDVTGYAGSRLYYPEAIASGVDADPSLTIFVVAFDRDLLIAVGAPAGEHTPALALLRQARELRRGYRAMRLLPDQHFTLATVDGAPVLLPIDVTLESTLRGLVLPA